MLALARTRPLLSGLALLAAAPAAGAQERLSAAAPAPVPTVLDAWSPELEWRFASGRSGIAIHATLLPDGRVHCFGYTRAMPGGYLKGAFLMTPTPLGQPLPDEQLVVELSEPLEYDATVVDDRWWTDDDLFCAGNTLTADGRVLTAGGTRVIFDLATQTPSMVGLDYATVFDGATDSWTRCAPRMVALANHGAPGRWYPALTRLPDGRILTTGGFDLVVPGGNVNLSVEVFDPTGPGSWSVVSPFGATPAEIFNPDYTQPVVLPAPVGGADVLMFGASAVPCFLDTSTGSWHLSSHARPGRRAGEEPNAGASVALLPLRLDDGEWGYAGGSVLMAGGDHHALHRKRIDVYDPVADAWRPRIRAHAARHHASTVLLPDGRVVVLAGSDDEGNQALRRAEYVDPARGFEYRLGSSRQREMRGYHNVTLLLPDGRVLVGGGLPHEDATERSSFRYLYPSYLFEPRPEISVAPAVLDLGQLFPLTSTGPAPAEVVLLALGSMTHSFDFNQRYVQLELLQSQAQPDGSHASLVRAPARAQLAPPGPYMLFVLDAARVPSVAAMVRLQ